MLKNINFTQFVCCKTKKIRLFKIIKDKGWMKEE